MTKSLVDDLIEWFSCKSRTFDTFIARHGHIKEWAISADFCFDKSLPNQTYAFTVIPLNKAELTIMDEIIQKLPRDLKKTRDVTQEMLSFLRSENFFHFGFVVDKHRNASTSDVKAQIDQMIRFFRKGNATEALLKNFESLGVAAQAKAFNTRLYMDMMVLCSLFTFIVLLLARDTDAQRVDLYPDRDKMTDWLDGLYGDLVNHMVRHDIAARGIDKAGFKVRTVAQSKQSTQKGVWYDPFVRLPDYVAGGLAKMSWLGEPLLADKQSRVRTGAFQDADNMIFCDLDFECPWGPSGFAFERFDFRTAFT